jgi:hypothetical protein
MFSFHYSSLSARQVEGSPPTQQSEDTPSSSPAESIATYFIAFGVFSTIVVVVLIWAAIYGLRWRREYQERCKMKAAETNPGHSNAYGRQADVENGMWIPRSFVAAKQRKQSYYGHNNLPRVSGKNDSLPLWPLLNEYPHRTENVVRANQFPLKRHGGVRIPPQAKTKDIQGFEDLDLP